MKEIVHVFQIPEIMFHAILKSVQETEAKARNLDSMV
jgi:hypothetical protein